MNIIEVVAAVVVYGLWVVVIGLWFYVMQGIVRNLWSPRR